MKKRLPIILTLLLVCIAVSYASAANVVASPQNLSVNGVDADCDKYNIDGSNYFKLRDLGDALGFSVDYDADSNTAIVLSKGSTVVCQNAFEKLLEDVNEKRRADMAREESFDGFEAYLQHHRGEVEITQAEIDSLKNLNNPGKAVLTRAEALEDVDLFFRALHYSYGAYYFQFGQAFHFIYNMENVDGKGYEPDLWCDPKTSLQAVLSMVERYDLGSAEGVAALRAQLPNILTK